MSGKKNGSAFPLRYISFEEGYSVAIIATTRGSEPYMTNYWQR